MPDQQKPADQLQVSIYKSTAYVRVRRRGSFKVSSALKEFGVASIRKGVTTLVMDMSECVGMDSTFMGVLAGLAFSLKRESGGEIVMVNLTSRTRDLLATLGLDQIVCPFMAGSTPEAFKSVLAEAGKNAEFISSKKTRKETAKMMLEAHENLVDLSPDNLPKFKDVLTFLREDVESSDNDEDAHAGN